jgi:hypothetical protein
MSAELAARRVAAAEMLTEYERDDEAAEDAVWAGRLAGMLTSLLGALDAADRDAEQDDARQFAGLRRLLGSYDWARAAAEGLELIELLVDREAS